MGEVQQTVFDKLIADGALLAYGLSTEEVKKTVISRTLCDGRGRHVGDGQNRSKQHLPAERRHDRTCLVPRLGHARKRAPRWWLAYRIRYGGHDSAANAAAILSIPDMSARPSTQSA